MRFPSQQIAKVVDIQQFDHLRPTAEPHLHNFLEQQHYRLSWWRAASDIINWRRFFDINELIAMRVEDDENALPLRTIHYFASIAKDWLMACASTISMGSLPRRYIAISCVPI